MWPFPEDGGEGALRSLEILYTDYWASLLGEPAWKDFANPLRDPISFPPSTEIEKIGYGTGHAIGWLMNASGKALFDAKGGIFLYPHLTAQRKRPTG